MGHADGVSWLSEKRIPLVVLGVAGLVIAASCWGLYSSEGAVKARERDARLATAQAGGPSSNGARPAVDVVTVRRTPSAEVVELSSVLEPVRSTWGGGATPFDSKVSTWPPGLRRLASTTASAHSDAGSGVAAEHVHAPKNHSSRRHVTSTRPTLVFQV